MTNGLADQKMEKCAVRGGDGAAKIRLFRFAVIQIGKMINLR